MNRNNKSILLAVLAVAFSLNAIAQAFVRNGDKVMRDDVGIEFSKPRKQEFILSNKLGERETHYAGAIQKPINVDDHKVYSKVIAQPKLQGLPANLHDYIFTNLDSALRQLPDGSYNLKLRDMLVDKSGRFIFFGYEGVRSADEHVMISLDAQHAIFTALCAAMDKAVPLTWPAHWPAFIDDADIWDAEFKVSGHQVSYPTKK